MYKVIDCRQKKSGNNKPGNSRLYDNQEKSATMTERHEICNDDGKARKI